MSSVRRAVHGTLSALVCSPSTVFLRGVVPEVGRCPKTFPIIRTGEDLNSFSPPSCLIMAAAAAIVAPTVPPAGEPVEVLATHSPYALPTSAAQSVPEDRRGVMAVIFGGFGRTKTKFFDKTKPARDWISTKTCKAAGYAVVYGVPALQLAGEVVGDVVEAAGIPEDPIQYNPIKTATPWFLKMFAGMSPDYHLARGNKYLDDALDLLVNYEEFIPPNLMTDLVKNWLTLDNEGGGFHIVNQVPHVADARQWKRDAKYLMVLTKRKSREARARCLMAKEQPRGRNKASSTPQSAPLSSALRARSNRRRRGGAEDDRILEGVEPTPESDQESAQGDDPFTDASSDEGDAEDADDASD